MEAGGGSIPEIATTWTPEQFVVAKDALIDRAEMNEDSARAARGERTITPDQMAMMIRTGGN